MASISLRDHAKRANWDEIENEGRYKINEGDQRHVWWRLAGERFETKSHWQIEQKRQGRGSNEWQGYDNKAAGVEDQIAWDVYPRDPKVEGKLKKILRRNHSKAEIKFRKGRQRLKELGNKKEDGVDEHRDTIEDFVIEYYSREVQNQRRRVWEKQEWVCENNRAAEVQVGGAIECKKARIREWASGKIEERALVEDEGDADVVVKGESVTEIVEDESRGNGHIEYETEKCRDSDAERKVGSV